MVTIGDRRWRSWLAEEPFSDPLVRALEDPPCNPFTETIVFFGGSYAVLPGTSENSASQLQTLLNAIFLGSSARSRLSRDFLNSARDLAFAVLTLSNACSAKSELRRDELPDRIATDEIIQPDNDRLICLRSAVSFSLTEIEELLHRRSLDVLSLLTIDAGAARASSVDTTDLMVYRRPILHVDESYVIIAPSSLPAALTHAILSKAHACGDLPVLAECIRETVFESVDLTLNRLGCTGLSGPRRSGAIDFPVTRATYSIDTDKLLELILLTDPLDDFDPDTVGGEWPLQTMSARVAK